MRNVTCAVRHVSCVMFQEQCAMCARFEHPHWLHLFLFISDVQNSAALVANAFEHFHVPFGLCIPHVDARAHLAHAKARVQRLRAFHTDTPTRVSTHLMTKLTRCFD